MFPFKNCNLLVAISEFVQFKNSMIFIYRTPLMINLDSLMKFELYKPFKIKNDRIKLKQLGKSTLYIYQYVIITITTTTSTHFTILQDNPFLLTARNLKPHSGIYHCCTFCSSSCGGGSAKTTICACGGTMEGFSGCGHGHVGHPGRRHWSCCGNILENSECLTANEFEY